MRMSGDEDKPLEKAGDGRDSVAGGNVVSKSRPERRVSSMIDAMEQKGGLDDVDEMLQKYDKEVSRGRRLTGMMSKAIFLAAIAMSAFHLYTSAFGVLLSTYQRAIHLAFVFVLGFVLYPASVKAKNKDIVRILDIVLAGIGVAICFYLVFNFKANVTKAGHLLWFDYILGILFILLVLEITRRTIGLALPIVAVVFMVYAYFGPYMPGILAHRGFSIARIVNQLFLTTEGILGTPLGVSSTFVFMFVLFGAFLEKTMIGQFFIDIAFSLTGRMSGGPAKTAVVASGLMGSISGSSTANVVTTGIFTIPMMKAVGYEPEYAGAVEAAASTGGQILPPVMGAAAFVMAEFTGIPYVQIIAAAAVPALLYYLAVGTMVHFAAKKRGLAGLSADQLPSLKGTLAKSWHLFSPIVVILATLMIGWTPLRAAFFGIVSAIAVSMFRKETRMSVKGFFEAMSAGARNTIGVAAACATAGIVVGIITMSGLGLKFGHALVAIAGGNLFLTLLMVMIASIILGMGLPTTAKYIVLATIAVPAMVDLNVPLIAAHMFVLYFGVVADVTPPVALAAYAGAGLAGGNPIKTGFNALKLATAGFIVPFVFVYSPSLMLVNTTFGDAVTAIASAIIGILSLGAAIEGYLIRRCNVLERIFLGASSLLLIIPGWQTDLMGFAALATVFVFQWMLNKKAR
jgi:TRAP transporter 4TM/12TM fusion protein